MRAITWPTVTVSPSSARISVIWPEAGAGSSMSTLSVESSTTVSPCLTVSPTFTDHSRIVPSVTDSPPVGVTMSIVWPALDSAAATPSASVVADAAASSVVAGGDSPDTGVASAAAAPPPLVEISASSAADHDRVALGGVDLHDRAGDRRGNFGVDLVGGYLDQRLVNVDAVALLLVPFEDGAFGDRVPHLGHDDFDGGADRCHLLLQL